MKKFLRVMRKTLLGVLCTLAILLAVLAIYHHAMLGIEVLYWTQKYPQEVLAIIGLDMTVPQTKDDIPIIPMTSFLLKAASFLGLQRIPFIYPITCVEPAEQVPC